MFYVYIIHSENFNKHYIGSSQNPWRRIEKHNTSTFNTFTSKYRPWEIKAVFEARTSRGQAEEIEKFIKKQKSKTLLIKLIYQNFIPNGKLNQLVRVPHVRD